MQALVKATVLPELELLARPFDRRFAAAASSPRYHDPVVVEAHRLADRLHEALRGAYHDYLYTNNPKRRLVCLSLIWEMASLYEHPWETPMARALLLFAALNYPPAYQAEAQERLRPSNDDDLLSLASPDGWYHLRNYYRKCKTLAKEKLAGCPNLAWPKSSPTSSFIEWILAPLPSLPSPPPASNATKPAPDADFLDLLRELDLAFATLRPYDAAAIQLFQSIGLHHAEAGRYPQALACLRQAVWGAYRAFLVHESESDTLVNAVGSLVHTQILSLHHDAASASAKERTKLAKALLVASRRLWNLSKKTHFLLFQAYAESCCNPEKALGTYLEYFEGRPFDGKWQWLEKTVWSRVQSRDVFFL